MENENIATLELLLETLKARIESRQFTALRQLLEPLQPADVAQLLEEIEEKDLPLVYRLLPKETAAETFTYMEPEQQHQLILSFSDAELRETLDQLYLDDAVDLIEEMPANVVARILKNTDAATRRSINDILHYPKDSAGSLMTIEYVYLRPNMTVTQAFEQIRRVGVDKETIYTCYVTENRRLLGVVTVKDLLISPPDRLIEDIMETNVVYIHTLDDKEFVAQQFSKYDLLAIPVVDQEKRIVGIVTVDDAMDVLQEENTEDIEMMAAITPTDKPYIRTGVWETWKKRIPWLLLLMISATFTGTIITGFEEKLAASVALTAFIPMLMDTGGNCGSQASVTIIRGLSLGELEMRDILRILWKELRVSLLCGITLATANFLRIWLIDGLLLHNAGVTVAVALTVSITMLFTVIIAKLVGCSLPILAKRIGFDPAVMASPFITTIVDALSLLVYFGIATVILKL
ncbi:MAG: magnesium transporter [Clostridia bacterium]|nr:magnesium transporter [Clostridia bacterium]